MSGEYSPPGGGEPIPIYAWPIASNAIEVKTALVYKLSDINPIKWGLQRLPVEPDNEFVPWPSRIERTATGVIVRLDGNMRPGVEYALLQPFGGEAMVHPVVRGPLRTMPPTLDAADQPLNDWAMPGAADRVGGDLLTRGGDFASVSGLEPIRTAVWSSLLTPEGRLDWDPTFGTSLELKRARASDLAAEQQRFRRIVNAIPGVADSRVEVMFRADHLLVSITLTLEGGVVETITREVRDGV